MFDGSFVDGTGTNYFFFNTKDSSGAPITLAGTPSLACNVNGGAAATSGLTLSVDHGGVTGRHRVALDVDDATLALVDGDLVEVYIAAGTVDSVSVVGTTVGRIAITDGSLLAQTIADIRAAILDRVLSGNHDTAGTPGAFLQNADAAISALNNLSQAEANAAADTALTDFFTSPATLVDLIWDEVITGANHNVTNSAAKFLREASEAVAGVTGTAQSATATTLVLASGGVTSDDILNGERVTIIEGTGIGQSRLVTDSVASTDTVTVDRAWTVNPDNTSVYSLTGADVDLRAINGVPVTGAGTSGDEWGP